MIGGLIVMLPQGYKFSWQRRKDSFSFCCDGEKERYHFSARTSSFNVNGQQTELAGEGDGDGVSQTGLPEAGALGTTCLRSGSHIDHRSVLALCHFLRGRGASSVRFSSCHFMRLLC